MQTATNTTRPATGVDAKPAFQRKVTNIITIVLPREESDRLKALAKEKGMLFSAFLKEHLRKAL